MGNHRNSSKHLQTTMQYPPLTSKSPNQTTNQSEARWLFLLTNRLKKPPFFAWEGHPDWLFVDTGQFK